MALGPSRKPGAGLYRPLADINVTPLVDVMLVLLIVFMVTAPMLSAGVKVHLPRAVQAATPLPQRDPVTITVSKERTLYVNADLTPREALIASVRARLAGREDESIRLRGDRDANYGDIVGVLDLLVGAGMTRVVFLTDARPQDVAAKPAPVSTP
ncbi:MAG: ExbD/TolR family protein [Roseiarcus sp.]